MGEHDDVNLDVVDNVNGVANTEDLFANVMSSIDDGFERGLAVPCDACSLL